MSDKGFLIKLEYQHHLVLPVQVAAYLHLIEHIKMPGYDGEMFHSETPLSISVIDTDLIKPAPTPETTTA